MISSDASTGVAGHVSNSLFIFELTSSGSAVFSLRPIWHRVSCEPGRVDHPPSKLLQRSFQLLPQLLAAARQARFHRSHIDSQSCSNLFITEAFNIPKNKSFAVSASHSLQRRSQNYLAFMSERLLFRVFGRLGQHCSNCLTRKPQRRVERNGGIAAPAPPPAPTVPGLVNGDAINPGSQVRFAAESADALEGSQERFLGQVTSFLSIFCKPKQ